MLKAKKILAVLAILVLVGTVLAACGAPKPENLLAGSWSANVGSFEFLGYEFIPNEDDPLKGTVDLKLISASAISGTYEIVRADTEDGKDLLKITYTLLMISTKRNFYFTVDETTLTLQEENSSVIMNYTREVAGTTLAATTG